MVTSCKSVTVTTSIPSRYRTFLSPPGSFMCYGHAHFPTHPQRLLKLSSIFIILSFQKCYINGSIQPMIFWDLLFFTQHKSPGNSSRLVDVSIICSFLFLSNIPWYGLPLSNHSLIEKHLDCFQCGANTNTHISICMNINFHFSGWNPRFYIMLCYVCNIWDMYF